MEGKIIKGIGGFYYVKTPDGVIECRARGVFRKDGIKPCVGDNVETENGSIVKILKRRNILVRPPVSNVDMLVIVIAAANPSPDTFLVDKLLVSAQSQDITPMLVVNKTDLASGEEIKKIYEPTGYTVVCASAEKNWNIDEIIPHIKGKTSAFAGLSGVGKSSILNLLTDNSLLTGSVSEKIKRGRHTTRHVELMELATGGYVFDTPGFSSFEPEGLRAADLQKYFPEMADAEGMCRFKGCSHINEPDCEVKRRIESGRITKERFESYKELYNTLKQVKEWET